MKLLQLAAARTPAAATVGSNLLLRCNASTAAPTDAAALRTTPLDALHRRHGGRLVPFAGYALPVQYGRHGIAASHRHCRRSATLFDVSHMQQTRLLGRDAAACMESVCTADLSAGALPDGGATLTVLTTEAGGIVDDAIVTRVSADELFLVSNAGRKVEDRAVLEAAVERFRGAGKEVELVFVDSDERALVAVQGPRAVRVSEEGFEGAVFVFRFDSCNAALLDSLFRCGEWYFFAGFLIIILKVIFNSVKSNPTNNLQNFDISVIAFQFKCFLSLMSLFCLLLSRSHF